jgi:hypothetical protein
VNERNRSHNDPQQNNLKEQLERMPRDKDRVRLVVQAAENFRFTCVCCRVGDRCHPSCVRVQDQLKELVEMQHFGDAKNQTAILLHPRLTDAANFDKTIMSCFKFDEDKKDIRDALGM